MIDLVWDDCYGLLYWILFGVVMVMIRFVGGACDVYSFDVVCCVMLVAIAEIGG